jgi:sialate O-acetylesterase
MRRLLTALAFASVWPGAALAQPGLDGPLTDHGVLQRDTPIVLSGMAAPGGEVEIALAGQSVAVMAGEDGAWVAEMPALPAGGPYELTLSDGDGTAEIEDALARQDDGAIDDSRQYRRHFPFGCRDHCLVEARNAVGDLT